MKPNHLNSLWLAACVLASSLLVAQCDNNSIALTFNAGTFLDEVSFNVTDADGNILLESMPGSEASDSYVYNLCLVDSPRGGDLVNRTQIGKHPNRLNERSTRL